MRITEDALKDNEKVRKASENAREDGRETIRSEDLS